MLNLARTACRTAFPIENRLIHFSKFNPLEVTEFRHGSNSTQTQAPKSLGGPGPPAWSRVLLGNSKESDEKLPAPCLTRYNVYVGKLRTANEYTVPKESEICTNKKKKKKSRTAVLFYKNLLFLL